MFVEPQQGASYNDQLAVAQAAESLSYSAFFRSDHYLAMSGDGLPGPTDSWVTLAGIARDHHHPAGHAGDVGDLPLPRPAGDLGRPGRRDERRRVDFGIGAGWFEAEHQAYAIPFPPLGERFERLTEQLEIITGLWSTPAGETFDYQGTHYSITDSPALPKPAQQPYPPIVIGGGGAKRTPALAARFAAEFNLAFPTLDFVEPQYGRVRAALEKVGRSPDDIVYSAAFVVCAGRSDAEIARRAAAISRDVDQLRKDTPLVGTPSEIVDRLAPFIEAGCSGCTCRCSTCPIWTIWSCSPRWRANSRDCGKRRSRWRGG